MKTPSPGFGVKHARWSATVPFASACRRVVCRGGRLEARVDAAFWPRLQHHPGFGLCRSRPRGEVRLLIRWMHLDRERVARIEELQQQREPAEAPGQFSQQLLRPLLKQLPDGPSFERSIGDAARMVLAVAQQPGFADGAIAGQRRGEQVGQTPAAPEPILIDRFESQWIQRRSFIWSCSTSSCGFPACPGRACRCTACARSACP